ncbi:MAG TPA: DUF3052 family protein [Gemmatimonadales bacterium]|jgi:hypothetical protein
MPNRLRLIHWNSPTARTAAKQLRAVGFVVNDRALNSGADSRALRRTPPDAMVIDLAKGFSSGRDVALALRQASSTRHVPIVFVGGEPAKVRRLKRLLPDATYATWRGIRSAIGRALAQPVAQPSVPGQMAGYSGTPLPMKLGIKPGLTVALIGAPAEFIGTLGPLPDGVRLVKRASPSAQLVLWFVKRRRDLEQKIVRMSAAFAQGGGMWIAWPKQASGTPTDVTQHHVRRAGLRQGLVDYKVAAIDSTWSGLKFARKRS